MDLVSNAKRQAATSTETTNARRKRSFSMSEQEIFAVFQTFTDEEKELIPLLYPYDKMPKGLDKEQHRQLCDGLTELAKEWKFCP